MGIHIISADAQNLGIAIEVLRQILLKSAGFQCTTRCEVFGIKIDHHPLPVIIRQGYLPLTRLIRQGELRCGLIDRRPHSPIVDFPKT